MKRVLAILACLAVAMPVPSLAQGNDDDFTPLGSRIRRERQFPLDLASRYDSSRMTELMRQRANDLSSRMGKCLYDRSHSQALSLLEQTDFGFSDPRQIGLDNAKLVRTFGFNDCMDRLTRAVNADVQLRFSAAAVRQWLVQEAYLDRFPESPNWIVPGSAIGARTFPLSERDVGVRLVMDFADCVVEAAPYDADFFFRAIPGSRDEQAAIRTLTPVLGPCLLDGQQITITPPLLRVWIGEALWHAANHSASAPAGGAGH